jgi:hypothetical protein
VGELIIGDGSTEYSQAVSDFYYICLPPLPIRTVVENLDCIPVELEYQVYDSIQVWSQKSCCTRKDPDVC